MLDLFAIFPVSLLCACVLGMCTPEAVKDDLHQCLAYQDIHTYYQFPIVNDDDGIPVYYERLCR